jgi:hypothetical protein
MGKKIDLIRHNTGLSAIPVVRTPRKESKESPSIADKSKAAKVLKRG